MLKPPFAQLTRPDRRRSGKGATLFGAAQRTLAACLRRAAQREHVVAATTVLIVSKDILKLF
jgi:hypothetical protein